MKTILSIAVAMILILAPVAFAIENGQSIRNASVTLYSQATGTTATVKPTWTFDYVMSYLGCDVIVSPVTAGTVTFSINGNQGSSTTNFDNTAYLVSSTTLSAVSAITGIRTVSAAEKPFRTIQVPLTAPTTTAIITVNCSAKQ